MKTVFDPTTHTYTVDGRIVPSVTQILHEAGIIDTAFYTEEARQRGSYVAEATALLDRGELELAELDPALVGYVDAWKKFKLDAQFVPELIEAPLFDPWGRFAGTLDRAGPLHGRWANVEIKTGGREEWHALQTAAYAHLMKRPAARRIVVYLEPDARYECHEFSDSGDHAAFMAALAVVTWKRNRGKR